jgi:hypothetical protein
MGSTHLDDKIELILFAFLKFKSFSYWVLEIYLVDLNLG